MRRDRCLTNKRPGCDVTANQKPPYHGLLQPSITWAKWSAGSGWWPISDIAWGSLSSGTGCWLGALWWSILADFKHWRTKLWEDLKHVLRKVEGLFCSVINWPTLIRSWLIIFESKWCFFCCIRDSPLFLLPAQHNSDLRHSHGYIKILKKQVLGVSGKKTSQPYLWIRHCEFQKWQKKCPLWRQSDRTSL